MSQTPPQAAGPSSMLEMLMDAAPALVGLSIDPKSRAAVQANLQMALEVAEHIDAPGDEAAPVFRP
ncbi:MAG: AtzG-like protein [Pseudomonadota bacterium]